MTSSSPREPDALQTLLARAIEALELDPQRARGRTRFELPASWSQGRASFGGLLAGLALAVLERALPPDRPLRRARSLQILFVAPITGEAELEIEVLRHGRSASLMRAVLTQAGKVGMTVTASFAADRDSQIELPGDPRPVVRRPEESSSIPYVEGLSPGFVRFFELRWATGAPPLTGVVGDGSFQGWVRLRAPFEGSRCALIAALVDAWPSPVLQNFSTPTPASSLSWSLDFVDAESEVERQAEGWWAYAVETDRASGGWVHSQAKLWSPAGKLVAVSRQTVAIYG